MTRLLKYATEEERKKARSTQTWASKQRWRKRQQAMKQGEPYRPHDFNFLRPDPQTIAERDQRMNLFYASEPTLNQIILGDPAPGRSMLDKKF
jgi:hypothetical protein